MKNINRRTFHVFGFLTLAILAILIAVAPISAQANGDMAGSIMGLSPRNFLWCVFGLCIVIFLLVDLLYFNRQAHKVSMKSALWQSAFWFGLATAFGAAIWYLVDHNLAADYYSAYLTEKMLSVDNLFVILTLFAFFKVPDKYHHRILYYGILGAVVFRAIFIYAGSALVAEAQFILYFFGLFLVWTGWKLLGGDDDENDVENMKAYKLVKRYLPYTEKHNGHFFVKENGHWKASLLFAVLVMVEITDIIFAVDSIPAVFSISQDMFIVYTSNIFAIMGLRALFFVVEGILKKFHHMSKGISLVLIFIGGKMLLGLPHYIGELTGWFSAPAFHIPSLISLGVILVLLGGSMLASVFWPQVVEDSDDEMFEVIEEEGDNPTSPVVPPTTPSE